MGRITKIVKTVEVEVETDVYAKLEKLRNLFCKQGENSKIVVQHGDLGPASVSQPKGFVQEHASSGFHENGCRTPKKIRKIKKASLSNPEESHDRPKFFADATTWSPHADTMEVENLKRIWLDSGESRFSLDVEVQYHICRVALGAVGVSVPRT